MLAGSMPFWIGVTDMATEGTFIEIGSGNAAPFLTWGMGQPDNDGNQDCVLATSGIMFDEICIDPSGNGYTGVCECEP